MDFRARPFGARQSILLIKEVLFEYLHVNVDLDQKLTDLAQLMCQKDADCRWERTTVCIFSTPQSSCNYNKNLQTEVVRPMIPLGAKFLKYISPFIYNPFHPISGASKGGGYTFSFQNRRLRWVFTFGVSLRNYT